MKCISPLHISFHGVLLIKQKCKCVDLIGVKLHPSRCSHSTGYDSIHFDLPNVHSSYGADFSRLFTGYGRDSSSSQFPSFSASDFFGWVVVFDTSSQVSSFSTNIFFGWVIVLMLPSSSHPQLTTSLGESSYLMLPPSSRPFQLATSLGESSCLVQALTFYCSDIASLSWERLQCKRKV